jgi:hypothetical protein
MEEAERAGIKFLRRTMTESDPHKNGEGEVEQAASG